VQEQGRIVTDVLTVPAPQGRGRKAAVR
jgi:hypothetical protein